MTIGIISFALANSETTFASDHAPIVSINLFVALLCGCIVIGHLLEENRWMNESITALAIGVCTGVIILLTTGGKSSRLLVFSEDLFFIYLLPPIIFNAGFQVKKKQFFRNFMTIMLFGAVGTLISFCVISIGAIHFFKKMNIGDLTLGDYLAIGAIFSATDSVCTLQVLNQDETPLLYSLVFGEGVVNDATSVVLFNAIQTFDLSHINSTMALQYIGNFLYLFILSTLLGVLAGLLSAYIIRKLYFGRHAFATLSFVSEIFIFLYVGMDALDIEKWRVISDSPGTLVGVSGILLGLILVGRAAFVFPLSFISNLTRKAPHEKVDFKQQVTVWWAGLMRGAVSMALAYNQFTSLGHTQLRGNAMMITSTISVVLFSTVVFGLMTKPLVRLLLPSPKHLTRTLSSEPSTPKSFIVPLIGNEGEPEADQNNRNARRPTSLRMLLTTPSNTVHYYWRKFDDAFMRPVFGGRGFVPFVPGSPTEQNGHQWQ
ncbi:hypothetical protein GOBAR_DD03104 [Gossypium barbadense]|nr:hypothetical protein GOBAR_DD03104 [Gossypium barbadense]